MKRYLLIIIVVLPIGFGIGHFHDQYQKAKAAESRSHMHSYGAWRSTGKTGGMTRSKIIMERKCYICGGLETKLSD